ncbi:carbonic anhydrase-related protein 10-like [Oratosquilla oratoria]|uniref:carbonic anhydrase-related protein 10-like n=1 Tax=Oratosquilla oratoria TaxID=337810 RepID=UPI003F76AEE2
MTKMQNKIFWYVYQETETVSWDWENWWTYDGISGPDFWGLINRDWKLCSKGRRQSPINIDPARLLYDPNLRLLRVDKHKVNGLLENTGHGVVLTLDTTKAPLNVTGGPLSYRYQLSEAHLHYGVVDLRGSEHTINGFAFPAESTTLSYATTNFECESYNVRRLSVHGLLPETPYFMTYEGSTTMPACHETVTWVVLNKPIYITKQQLHTLRQLHQNKEEDKTKAPLANNFRPPQKLHHRPIRTNIDFTNTGGNCPTIHREAYYKANTWSLS